LELLSLEIDKKDDINYYNIISNLTNLQNKSITATIYAQNDSYDKITYNIEKLADIDECRNEIISKINNVIKSYMNEEAFNYFEKSYFYFEDAEIDSIKKIIEEEMNSDIKINLILKVKISEYLEDSSIINISGFVKFRLKFIGDYVQQIVEKCIDNYLIKKEYTDFIGMLKYFSEDESEEKENINIMIRDGKLQIYNELMEKISLISNVEFSEELQPSELIYDESIINSIITISPKKIIVHLTKNYESVDEVNKNTIDIINKLFVDRIKFCMDCEYCKG
jgi:putative sporulation protein YtxC